MDARKVSAQFAAYVWFTSRKASRPTNSDTAVRFARDHWASFLPCADEGIGRLLIRVVELDRATDGQRPTGGKGRARRSHSPAAR
jgi:hypothetical protein